MQHKYVEVCSSGCYGFWFCFDFWFIVGKNPKSSFNGRLFFLTSSRKNALQPQQQNLGQLGAIFFLFRRAILFFLPFLNSFLLLSPNQTWLYFLEREEDYRLSPLIEYDGKKTTSSSSCSLNPKNGSHFKFRFCTLIDYLFLSRLLKGFNEYNTRTFVKCTHGFNVTPSVYWCHVRNIDVQHTFNVVGIMLLDMPLYLKCTRSCNLKLYFVRILS